MGGMGTTSCPSGLSCRFSLCPRFRSLHEHEAVPFGKRAHGFEPFSLEGTLCGVGEMRAFRRTGQQGAEAAARPGTDEERATCRAEDARDLANRPRAIVA